MRAHRIVIAVGTRPARPPSVQFDDRTIIDSDGLLKLESRVPRTMTVVGAGVIGVEYASMFGRARDEGDAWSTSATGCSRSSTARSARRSSTCCGAAT